ncbi:MAG: Do family serine endopeptidase [Candidatus Schekmanbacteria bacterium]|nr:MAG: Do family serine endopeptidase [Candidatus Schekmanbacteria bacterium]
MKRNIIFLKILSLLLFGFILWNGVQGDLYGKKNREKIWLELNNPKSLVKLDENKVPLSFVPLVNNFYKAVVNINTVFLSKEDDSYHNFLKSEEEEGIPFDDLLENFNKKDRSKYYRRVNLGSGFVINPDGYILTNNHVIKGATKINVTFWNKEEYEARIIGRDVDNDIALLKIDVTKKINYVPLGSSNLLNVGEWVVAIGNPYGLSHSITAGIVSAKGRIIGIDPVHTFIQTDAAINPGNSGGPLFNIYGEVVGINTAIIANGTGIGFAIPVDRVKRVLEKIVPENSIDRSWLGIRIQPLDKLMSKSFGIKGRKGVLVGDVVLGSPANRAGIKTGDVIFAFNGKEVTSCRQLFFQVEKSAPDSPSEVQIYRNGSLKTIQVVPEKISRRFIVRSSADLTNLLGIEVEEIPNGYFPEKERKIEGVFVKTVDRGSVAYRAGINEGDIVMWINGRDIRNLEEFDKTIDFLEKYENIVFLLYRNGHTFYSVASRKG